MSHYGATARFLLIQFLHILDYSSHHFPEQTELIYISRGGGGKVAKALKKKKEKAEGGGAPITSFGGREKTLPMILIQIPAVPFLVGQQLFVAPPHHTPTSARSLQRKWAVVTALEESVVGRRISQRPHPHAHWVLRHLRSGHRAEAGLSSKSVATG